MFGRPTLGELLCSQHDETKQWHEESMRRLDEQHEEFMRYQEKRDEEFLARTEEFREFNREILLRNEKVYTALVTEMEEGRRQLQANTRAVLSVLDRLEGSGGAAAA